MSLIFEKKFPGFDSLLGTVDAAFFTVDDEDAEEDAEEADEPETAGGPVHAPDALKAGEKCLNFKKCLMRPVQCPKVSSGVSRVRTQQSAGECTR